MTSATETTRIAHTQNAEQSFGTEKIALLLMLLLLLGTGREATSQLGQDNFLAAVCTAQQSCSLNADRNAFRF